jgi:hypothetical protein
MSALYSIIPIKKEYYEQKLPEWLAEFGIDLPPGISSRYPTPIEIRRVLDETPEWTKHFNISATQWDAEVSEPNWYSDELGMKIYGRDAIIHSVGFSSDESMPLHIYFRNGWEEFNLEIVHRLTKYTGALILMADFDAVPVLIFPDAMLPDLLEQWKQARRRAEE